MALDDAGIQLIAQGVAAYVSDLNKADNATEGFYKTLGSADKPAGAFQQVITGALRHVGVALVEFAAQGAKAIGGFVKDSIGLAGDFEAGMLGFQAVAGKEVDLAGLEEFRDLFLDIGKRLPVSTTEVQLAATEMVKGGIDPATIAAGGLEQNIQFAAAAMSGDLVKAAEISAKIVGGWAGVGATAAEKADLLTHATDLLTKAANASATDVEGLSLGIFNAQGIARTAGVSFDDLTTTLAALAPRFESSSVAGNSLKNMIARLQPTTQPATDAMTALGLYTEETGSAFYDAAGNFVGFEQAAQLLQTSLQGLTKEQQAATLQQIFGNDAMGAAAALAEIGAAGYQEMADALANANGVADAAALKQQGFNTSLDNAMGSVEALKITIGSALLPILGDLLDNYIAPGVNAITDFADAVGEKGLVSAIETLSPELASIIKLFGESGGAADQLGGVIEDLNGVWNTALTVVENVMNAYMAIAQAILPIITAFIDEHGDEISAFFQSTWDSIIQIVNLALRLYDAIVPPILNGIAAFIADHGEEIQLIFGGVWEMITSLVTGALETIKGVLSLALNVINGDWDAAWTDLETIANAQITAIQGFITGFLDAIAGIFGTSMAEIGQTWANNWEMLVDIVTSIDWTELGASIVQGIISGINDWAGKLFSTLKDMAQSAYDSFYSAIAGGSPAQKFVPAGQSIVQGIMQGLSDTWPTLMDQVGELSDELIDQLADLGTQVQGIIADSFGATASIDRQVAANLDKMKDVLPQDQINYQDQLNRAQKEAEKFTDPVEGAKYFAMRSKQILETAKLEKEASEAATAEDRARIEEKLRLINRAHEAELKQFEANQAAQGNPYQDLIDTIQQLMKDGLPINDSGFGHDLMLLLNKLLGIPGYASGGPVKANKPIWVGEQGPELFFPTATGRIMDNLSSRQSQLMSAQSMQNSGNITNTSHGPTINMPVYTNQSPAVLRDSLAIAGAALL